MDEVNKRNHLTRLSFQERQSIEKCLKEGQSVYATAKILGIPESTIRGDLKTKGFSAKSYNAMEAQKLSNEKKWICNSQIDARHFLDFINERVTELETRMEKLENDQKERKIHS